MFGAYRDVCPYSELMHQQLGSRPAPVQRQRQTAANRWGAARSAAQAATLAAVNFFYFDNFISIYIYIYIYIQMQKTKNLQELHMFVLMGKNLPS